MPKLISISIDLLRIDKRTIKEVTRQNGKKAKFINLTLSLNDTPDKQGNHCSIYVPQTKEERDAKKDRHFVGNGKVVWSNDSNTPQDNNQKEDNFSDLPF